MKIIYFYSPIYEAFHKHISNSLDIAGIPYENIFMDDLKKDKSSGHTFAGGQLIKIETLLNSIKDNMGSDIVFIDATTIFNPKTLHKLKDYFASYERFDLSWQTDISQLGDYNIGVTKIKCNSKMLGFFNDVLSHIKKRRGWDQAACNYIFQQNQLNINFKQFDDKMVAQRMEDLTVFKTQEDAWGSLTRNYGDFYIWKHLMNHKDKTPEQISSFRFNILKSLGLLVS